MKVKRVMCKSVFVTPIQIICHGITGTELQVLKEWRVMLSSTIQCFIYSMTLFLNHVLGLPDWAQLEILASGCTCQLKTMTVLYRWI